jgi:hypothetical protein
MNRDMKFQFRIAGDSDQVNVKKLAMDGLGLPVADHDSRWSLPSNREREDGIVAGLGVENLENLLGIHCHGNRGTSAPVNHARDPPRTPEAARRILPEILPRLDFHSLNLGHDFLLLNCNSILRVGIRYMPADAQAPALHPVR